MKKRLKNRSAISGGGMTKNILWNTFGSIFYSGCQWLVTVIVVHVSAYADAGYLSLAMTMSSSFSAISLFSMRNYQVSDVKGEYSSGQYISSRVWTCLGAFVSCAIFAAIGSSPEQMLCVDAFMLIRVAEALSDVMHGVNQSYNRYDYIGKSYILRGLATVVLFTGVLKLTNRLALTLFCVAGVNLLLSLFYDCRKTEKLDHYKVNVKDKALVVLLKQCAPLVIFTFLLSLENLIPKNVLESLSGAEVLGIYSSIATPTLVVQVFAQVVFNPFIPKFSKTYYDGEVGKFRGLMRKTYLLLVGSCLVIPLCAMVVGRIFLKILFGEYILQYYYLFMPIIFVTLCTGIVWILSAIVIMLRRIKVLLIGILIDFGLLAVLTAPMIRQFGSNGVSLVQLISLPILIAFMIAIIEMTSWKRQKELSLGKTD